MLLRPTKSIRTTLFLPQIIAKDGSFLSKSQLRRDSSPLPAAPSSGRISPAILFIIVIVAIIFFIAGLLHLLVRFLARKQSSSSSRRRPGGGGAEAAAGPADALQRQLQQLFHLHDAGLDQAFIDALPVFPYRDIADSSDEPFDCAVCLCEFTPDDRLRLLPVCGHAFHLSCIDTWLLSNSTCPLCRGSLFVPGLAIENPIFEFDGESDEERPSSRFPVRLGKFMNLSNPNGSTDGGEITVTGESSSSQLDARRCYSMGSYQYVVADANLQVELPRVNKKSGDSKCARGSGEAAAEEGKRLGIGSRGESFSVSKIWLWSNKKGKHPVSSDASSLDGGLPWMKERTSVGDS